MKAAIDIGSNTLLLTVVDDADRIVHDEARVVGLGRGLGDRGLFAPDRMAAAEAVLADYAAIADGLGVAPRDVRAVATSGARRAMNAQTFFARVREKTGLIVRVISGDEEARLTSKGALRDLELPEGPVLVVDLGGGSTELVLGTTDTVVRRVSLEIGTIRLTEAHLGVGPYDPAALGRLQRQVDLEVARFPMEPPPRTVIAVAGTATTLAAMALGLERYDAERVHGSRLTRVDLARFVDTLLAAGPEERRRLARVSPERADWLLAGAVILEKVLVASRRHQMVVSDRGLRFGLLAD